MIILKGVLYISLLAIIAMILFLLFIACMGMWEDFKDEYRGDK